MALPYPVILVTSLVAVGVVYALRLDGIYALPWLMFFTATASSVYGLGVGLTLALGSVGVLGLFRSSPQDYLVMGIILSLSAYLADQIGRSLRRAHHKARQLTQLQGVFMQGLEVLPRFLNREQLLRQLPTMLAQLLHGSLLRIWIPSGAGQLTLLENPGTTSSEISPSPVVQRALQEPGPAWSEEMGIGEKVALPTWLGFPAPTGPYELAVALRVRNETVAVLQFLRGEGWQKQEIELFSRLALAMSRQLEQLHDLELRRLLLKVADHLTSASDKRKVAKVALRYLLPALDMEAGVVLQYRRGTLRGLAWRFPRELRPQLTPLARKLPYREQGLAWQTYHTGTAQFTENYSSLPEVIPELKQLGFETLVAYPVHTRDAMKGRVVLVLGTRRRIAWTPSKQEILLGIERLLSSALERALLEELHKRINRLLTEAWSYPSRQVYRHILEAAVDLVPGSDAGSLWVRDGNEFACEAAVGSVWDCGQRWSEATFQTWYAYDKSMASQGRPRILRRDQLVSEGRGANLCLPVSHQGRVLAYMNLDSLHDSEAFAEDSLATVQLFATPIATLVHEIQSRAALEKAALTDGLTGLYNRRAFDLRLKEECERAARYQYPLTLLVLDLKNFKPINDRLGHSMGDQALIAVARTLSQTQRAGDMIFRWGGDEFAVLLPQTPKEAAAVVSNRILEAISSICIGDYCLSANIGYASFPVDAQSAEVLLQIADQRMYANKNKIPDVATAPPDESNQ
ncbi:MAG: diguanylate cyclase domain-containing protein [Meiothermus ruber]|jgi:diguanylate cyclase (GGDEF)-like protein|uniref:Diguanylate cyclase n=1 Tax=Meiothermus ruber TaxID=277 RepID=A0A7C3HRF9_MEIRU